MAQNIDQRHIQQERQNERYKTDPEFRANRKERDKIRKEKNKVINQQILGEYLIANPCIDCDEPDILVLDFHHRNPQPGDISVPRLASQGASIKCLNKEINKCDVLCRNCHFKRHGHKGCNHTALRKSNANSWRNRF